MHAGADWLTGKRLRRTWWVAIVIAERLTEESLAIYVDIEIIRPRHTEAIP